MTKVGVDLDALLAETSEYGVKLAKALNQLMEIGEPELGTSARERVWQRDKVKLLRYAQVVPMPNPIPVLVVYALVNRPYVADLQPDRSLIQGFLRGGLDVYLVDWGYPDGADRFLGLDDYIHGYIGDCVDYICRQHGLDSINLVGICQGGTFSLCYAASRPGRVKNLITTVTPVDFFTEDDLLSRYVRNIDIDLLVDTLGNLPGEALNAIFVSLQPFRLAGQKYLDMLDQADDPEALRLFMRMEKWIFDSPDQAGSAFRQFIKDCYQDNKLIKGELRIGDTLIDLSQVTMPVLNIYAARDHLVPPAASKALSRYVGSSDYRELVAPGGHIGMYVSAKAQQVVAPSICEWLAERTT
jgi:polyhydroxyalkanoate synthase